RFTPGDRPAARAALSLDERPVLLWVGRIAPMKGLDTLLDAIARLRAGGAGVTLLSLGGQAGEPQDGRQAALRPRIEPLARGRAWPRRPAASTRRSGPARPRTLRPRAATTDPRRRCATLPRTVGVLLEVENVTTEFVTRGGVVRAADGVSWDVGEGETVALVGESGCGKSVSALSIMRLVAPPAGRIVGGRVLFKGRDLLALSDEAMRQIRGREIAMIV